MSRHTRDALTTYAIVALCSMFFCSKGVFAKSAYAHGADPIEVLALRMGIALPFFLAVGWFCSRRALRLSRAQWLQLAGLGFVGYYISSFVNFCGLQFISVGLERIVLYTYPSLVLLGGALFKRRALRRGIVIGMMVSYAGILVAFAGETGDTGSTATLLGVGLVFASALTYAFFITASGELVGKLGALRFTAVVVGFSCLFIITHYLLTRPVSRLGELPPPVYLHGAILAVFGTVVPSFLMGFGLKRAGAQKFAVIGTIGPVTTFALAWAVLGEIPNAAQLAGFGLALTGGLAVALLKEPAGASGDREEVDALPEAGIESQPADPVTGARQADGA